MILARNRNQEGNGCKKKASRGQKDPDGRAENNGASSREVESLSKGKRVNAATSSETRVGEVGGKVFLWLSTGGKKGGGGDLGRNPLGNTAPEQESLSGPKRETNCGGFFFLVFWKAQEQAGDPIQTKNRLTWGAGE